MLLVTVDEFLISYPKYWRAKRLHKSTALFRNSAVIIRNSIIRLHWCEAQHICLTPFKTKVADVEKFETVGV